MQNLSMSIIPVFCVLIFLLSYFFLVLFLFCLIKNFENFCLYYHSFVSKFKTAFAIMLLPSDKYRNIQHILLSRSTLMTFICEMLMLNFFENFTFLSLLYSDNVLISIKYFNKVFHNIPLKLSKK